MQSPVAGNLSRHKPDHPAPGLWDHGSLLSRGKRKWESSLPHPPHPAQILISVFTLNAQAFLSQARWDLGVEEVGSVEHYTRHPISNVSFPQALLANTNGMFRLRLSPLPPFIYAAPSVRVPPLSLHWLVCIESVSSSSWTHKLRLYFPDSLLSAVAMWLGSG